MKQITIRQLVRQGSKAKLEEWMPCEIVSDGEVIAVLVPQYDIKANTKSDKLTELPLSKHRQTSSAW